MRILNTDVLVIGSGLAGATYALKAARNGLNVIMICGGELAETNSDLAQGGVVFENPKTVNGLLKDIQTAGCGLCNIPAAKDICVNGHKVIEELFIKDLGVPFDTDKNGKLLLTREGAHSKKRILYSKDTTGHAMLSRLLRQVKKTKNIKTFTHNTAVDLLTLSHNSSETLDRYYPLTCFGAYILDNKKSEVYAVTAKKTVLATGGAGQLYRHTTNSPSSFGHGIAMAYRVGARVMNMEFMQFHPTVFGKGKTFLISEAVRGEGAVLVNSKGRQFMNKYHPMGSLAPRDVVARAIEEQRLHGDKVFLDLSAIKPEHVKERFPNIYSKCLEQGVDITKENIPVVPAAHYFCGGVYADVNGRTNILNLNAVGETACTGLHGANRLASTSLLESLSMGAACAKKDFEDIKKTKFHIPVPREWRSPRAKPDLNLIKQDISTLQSTMWNYVGLIRSKTHLQRAEKILRHLHNEIAVFYQDVELTPELINLRNGTQTGLLITYAALKNNRNIGCHFIS
ncbi:FAD dependent oxidoreductase [Elusimicrobium minutum Pei191]|uniref:L-aspartate oxidase n=1 Tax=Elusimicrobium minutum (strain Pei191) TaxID=445932 RepID=B2KBY5_ELUMP|nr:L-aspartate oxidase [Elusimicrobium minutum]ACC97889.1 FAD dependent oxidoreductase [Elusimicrobium minutum Pei191]